MEKQGILYNDEAMKSAAFIFSRDSETKEMKCEIEDRQYVQTQTRDDEWIEFVDAACEVIMRFHPEDGKVWHQSERFFHDNLPSWIDCYCHDSFDSIL